MRRLSLGVALLLAMTVAPATAQLGGAEVVGPGARIIGGDTVPDGKYPFIVSLQQGTGFHFCGGSVIAPTWILTAAHCVTDTAGTPDVAASAITVVIGRYDLDTTDGEAITASSLAVHPDWDGEGDGVFEYDFALIELSSPTTATPVPLATAAELPLYDDAGDAATVMGWGYTDPASGPSSTILKEVDVPIVPDATCTDPGVWGGFVDAMSELCAGDDDVDSCVGDSGGPLVAPPGTEGWKQIGIVSSGPFPCADPVLPGIYAEVVAGLTWIDSKVNYPPAATDAAASVVVDTPTVITMHGTDPDMNPLTFSIDTPPTQGTLGLVMNPGGPTAATVEYTPMPGYIGPDSFDFQVDDGEFTDVGTVSITVSAPANADPVADPGSEATTAGHPVTVTLSGSDDDADPLTFAIATPPAHGSLGLLTQLPPANAVVTYAPAPGFFGTDSFSFTVGDGKGGTATATVSISVVLVPDTAGLVDIATATWYLRNSVGSVTSFLYGNPADLPISGDWNASGISTPGLYRQSDGFFYARNANTTGVADAECYAGDPADIPLSGDWDGDGDDNLGIYRPSEQMFYLFTITCTGSPMGAAQISLEFGNPGDKPVAGDWDGDGIDEIGLHRESTGLFYWKNDLITGVADGQIIFGNPADRFVAGDWGVVDRVATPTLFRPEDLTFYFRHSLTQGNADNQFVWAGAGPGWLPVAGNFGLG